jgi:hypothetical protein
MVHTGNHSLSFECWTFDGNMQSFTIRWQFSRLVILTRTTDVVTCVGNEVIVQFAVIYFQQLIWISVYLLVVFHGLIFSALSRANMVTPSGVCNHGKDRILQCSI